MYYSIYKVTPIITLLYKAPSITSSVIIALFKNTEVEVIKISNGWAYCKYKNSLGYVQSSKLQLVTPGPSVLGSVEIKYIEENNTVILTNNYTDLTLGTYTYEALDFPDYKLISPSPQRVTLTTEQPKGFISFIYKKVYGSVTINYIDEGGTPLAPSDIYSNLSMGTYIYEGKEIINYVLISSKEETVYLTKNSPNAVLNFRYKKAEEANYYVIELEKFNISNNNTNGIATTKGINDALRYGKTQGYSKITLPKGNYSIDMTEIQENVTFVNPKDSSDKWTKGCKGIVMVEGIEFNVEGCTFLQVPCEDPHPSVFTFAKSHNSKLIGGSIYGDKYAHDYGLKINWDENSLESGSFDTTTGAPISDNSRVRTKNFITSYSDGSPLPQNFYICPFDDTSKNTVDGGMRTIYFYDANNNFISSATNGFITMATMPTNAVKIKISFKDETRLDAKYYITKRLLYFTFESGCGISIFESNNIEINGTEIRECIGDCIGTGQPPVNNITMTNLLIENCTLEDSRRQGISFTAVGDNVTLKNCNIGLISGTDPQCGIDFEVEGGILTNTVIDGCHFYENKKWDIINYNCCSVEVVNCNFTGAIATHKGYSMNIHDNSFNWKDTPDNDKVFKNVLLQNSNKDVFVYNNSFEGGKCYLAGENNTFYNNASRGCSSILYLPGEACYNNKYYDGTVSYSGLNQIYKYEDFYNCHVAGENNGTTDANGNYDKTRCLSNCSFTNCSFGGNPTLAMVSIKDSTIYNNNKSFVSSWGANYTIDNCIITTEYTTNIPFIDSEGPIAKIENCTMKLAVTPLLTRVLGTALTINNSTITFLDTFYKNENIEFAHNQNGTRTFTNIKFYKAFNTPTILLPPQVNSYFNDSKLTDNVDITI